MAKKKTREDIIRKQIEQTIVNLDEAQETLTDDAINDEEKERIIRKNEHRKEQISALENRLTEE